MNFLVKCALVIGIILIIIHYWPQPSNCTVSDPLFKDGDLAIYKRSNEYVRVTSRYYNHSYCQWLYGVNFPDEYWTRVQEDDLELEKEPN